ncbi:MAG: DUF4112 domain-containing protein [Prevotella sp.]|nr:DUF4112 domain-containing protein [Prevotella sp.]
MNSKPLNDKKERLKSSSIYMWMQRITQYLDRYNIDGFAGLVPGGIGDAATGLLSVVHVYFSAIRLHSIPLTLAVLNNTLRDILLGMIPFYVGDLIDFFHKANVKNMALIDGFINNDPVVTHEVNRKAWQAALVLVALLAGICLMIFVLIWLTKSLGTILFS